MAISIRGLAAGLLAATLAWLPAEAVEGERRLVLVTVDGLAWTEVFRGADPERAADRAFVTELPAVRSEFIEPPDRAGALMPFLHGVVAKEGVLLGDRDHGSCVGVSNEQWFSYPGYNEILTGKADPAIRSNSHGRNRNVTFLEWLNRQRGFVGRVQAIGSWTTFRDILNAPASGLPVNAGWDGAPGSPIAKLEAEVPRLWPSVRFDAFTQAYVLEALRRDRPRALYIAYGETDDFAHDGRYDQMLWSAKRTDAFLAELWKTLQSDRNYAGKTTLIITTDHGRGVGSREAWRHHGKPFLRSDETWIAAIGPGVAAGRKPSGACASANQVAATALTALGVDWRAFDPSAGAPLDIQKAGR